MNHLDEKHSRGNEVELQQMGRKNEDVSLIKEQIRIMEIQKKEAEVRRLEQELEEAKKDHEALGGELSEDKVRLIEEEIKLARLGLKLANLPVDSSMGDKEKKSTFQKRINLLEQIEADSKATSESGISLNFFMKPPYPHGASNIGSALLPEIGIAQVGGIKFNQKESGNGKSKINKKEMLSTGQVNDQNDPQGRFHQKGQDESLGLLNGFRIAVGELTNQCFNKPKQAENYNLLVTPIAGGIRFGFGLIGLMFRWLSIGPKTFHRYAVQGYFETLGTREGAQFNYMMPVIEKTKGALGPFAVVWFGFLFVVNLAIFAPLKMIVDRASYTLSYTGVMFASLVEGVWEIIKFPYTQDADNLKIYVKRFLGAFTRVLPEIVVLIVLPLAIGSAMSAFIGSSFAALFAGVASVGVISGFMFLPVVFAPVLVAILFKSFLNTKTPKLALVGLALFGIALAVGILLAGPLLFGVGSIAATGSLILIPLIFGGVPLLAQLWNVVTQTLEMKLTENYVKPKIDALTVDIKELEIIEQIPERLRNKADSLSANVSSQRQAFEAKVVKFSLDASRMIPEERSDALEQSAKVVQQDDVRGAAIPESKSGTLLAEFGFHGRQARSQSLPSEPHAESDNGRHQRTRSFPTDFETVDLVSGGNELSLQGARQL